LDGVRPDVAADARLRLALWGPDGAGRWAVPERDGRALVAALRQERLQLEAAPAPYKRGVGLFAA